MIRNTAPHFTINLYSEISIMTRKFVSTKVHKIHHGVSKNWHTELAGFCFVFKQYSIIF